MRTLAGNTILKKSERKLLVEYKSYMPTSLKKNTKELKIGEYKSEMSCSTFDDHRLGVNQCFIFPELSHKFLDPLGVVKTLFLSTLWSLVFQLDHQTGVEEG